MTALSLISKCQGELQYCPVQVLSDMIARACFCDQSRMACKTTPMIRHQQGERQLFTFFKIDPVNERIFKVSREELIQ